MANISDFYTPLSKQAEFHQSLAKYRAMVGGFGSGKTRALLMEAIITCLCVPGCNTLIIRRTSPDLQKTVIDKFEDPNIVPRWVYKSYNKNDKIVTFANGSELFFGYCQRDSDVNQYLSTEYAFIGIEEAGEFSFRVWEALTGRARVSTEMKDISGADVHPSVGIATNPFGVGYSWIKRLFVDHKPMEDTDPKAYNPKDYYLVHSTVLDNPYTCTPEYIKTLEGLTGSMKQKALYGNLNLISGQYFDNFDPARHVKKWDEVTFKPWHPKWIAADWGMAHSFPVYWFTKGEIKDPINKNIRVVNVVYREHIMRDMNAIEAADDIARMCDHNEQGRITEKISNFYLSWERFMRQGKSQGFDHSIAEQMGSRLKKFGLPQPQPADKNRVDGWALMYQLLDMDQLVFMENCEKAISHLPLLTRDDTNLEDVLKSDTLADDIGDALRYGLKSFLKAGNVPQSVKDAEALAQIKDPYARMIIGYKKHIEKQQGKQPVRENIVLPWMKR